MASIVTESTLPVTFGNGTIRICRRGTNKSLLLVALSRPKQFNAFNDSVYEDLVEIMRLTVKDPTLVGIVLTGSGPYFSSGADLKESQHSFEPEEKGRQTLLKPVGQFMISLIRFPKLFIAAVNGPAIGIGVTLLLHCDIVHCCSKTATFWVPFTRLALVPELSSSTSFIECHGLSKANELLLLGRKINAQTAYEYNICSKLVTNCDTTSGDPFGSSTSLANIVCNDIDTHLLSLPLYDKTISYFISLMKGATGRRQRMEQACHNELIQLDERFDSGQVYTASKHVSFGKKSSTTSSKKQKQLQSKL